ncbi:hypothetical protein BDZ91DRAFT_709115 [Kalaharituber pfeilii]|nr:hypothetical protein BDZ91DRAFT_709115 [Kalaharituber pfeilii]
MQPTKLAMRGIRAVLPANSPLAFVTIGPRLLWPRKQYSTLLSEEPETTTTEAHKLASANLPKKPPKWLRHPKNPVDGISAETSTNPDHRTLANEQELFFTNSVSPGCPVFLPNGTRVFNKLVAFLKAQYAYYGFKEVITPTIYKRSLWEQSGHWDNYANDMFKVYGRGASGETEGKEIGEEEDYGLKPMNCPGHCLIFRSSGKSYRDLPVRYADFSSLHRNEISGALSGLTRLRRFHQDDAHIFCRPSQIGSEISATLEFIDTAYKVFRLPPHRLVLSTRPWNHIGTVDEWDRAEDALIEALKVSGKEWSMNEGDGAFYGPKIDIILKDSDGKDHQTATIQLDFQLPTRFALGYQAVAPEKERKGIVTTDPAELATSGVVQPVIIHRAVFGSLERFMALLIEHYDGRWPFWLSPKQAIVIPVAITDEIVSYCKQIQRIISGIENVNNDPVGDKAAIGLQSIGRRMFDVDIDLSSNSLSKKIREARSQKYNHVIVIGGKNVASQTVTVNTRVDAEPENGRSPRPEAKDLSANEVYNMFVSLEQQYL